MAEFAIWESNNNAICSMKLFFYYMNNHTCARNCFHETLIESFPQRALEARDRYMSLCLGY